MAERFPIRFGRLNGVLLKLIGAGRSNSYLDLDGNEIRVRMGFGFSADIPRESVTACSRVPYVWWAYGVHGWGGRWIVNGSGHNMVSVKIDPPVRARTLGMPCKLKDLWISLEDPDGLCRALGR